MRGSISEKTTNASRPSNVRWVMMVLLCLGFSLNACSREDKEVAAHQQEYNARKAVAAYASGVDAIKNDQSGWVRSYSAAVQGSDVSAIRARVNDEVVPQLNRYIQRLDGVPTEHPVVEENHRGLVQAYRALLEAFGVFVKDLDSETYNENRRVLMSALSRFHRAQAEYREQMSKTYKELGIQMSESEG